MPEVSIIMPVYNGEEYLELSVNSVINQTFRDFEFIVINDASFDDTGRILDKYQRIESRIRVITNPQRLGVVKSLNIGLKHAVGNLIARIDADDRWYSNKLGLQIKTFEQDSDLMLLGTQKRLIDEHGNEIVQRKRFHYYNYLEVKKNIHKANIFTHSSVVFRKKILDEVGFYDERYKNSEDYELWLRICATRKAMILPQTLVDYRIHSHSVSSKRLREQLYYSIKARIVYIPKYGFSGFLSWFFFREVLFFILPSFVVEFFRKIRASIGRLRKRF